MEQPRQTEMDPHAPARLSLAYQNFMNGRLKMAHGKNVNCTDPEVRKACEREKGELVTHIMERMNELEEVEVPSNPYTKALKGDRRRLYTKYASKLRVVGRLEANDLLHFNQMLFDLRTEHTQLLKWCNGFFEKGEAPITEIGDVSARFADGSAPALMITGYETPAQTIHIKPNGYKDAAIDTMTPTGKLESDMRKKRMVHHAVDPTWIQRKRRDVTDDGRISDDR
jgi:hypothetical protein